MRTSTATILFIFSILTLSACTTPTDRPAAHNEIGVSEVTEKSLSVFTKNATLGGAALPRLNPPQERAEPADEVISTVRFAGVSFSYPASVADEVITERLPTRDQDAGTAASPQRAPSSVAFTFVNPTDERSQARESPLLLVLPTRQRNGLHYLDLTDGERQRFDVLERRLRALAVNEAPTEGEAPTGEGQTQRINFINGAGVREVTIDADKAVYHFEGLTNDQRYVVELTFPLAVTANPNQFRPRLTALDGMVRSLFIDVAAEALNTATCRNDGEFVTSLTIPDGTEVEPGAAFVKTWRLRNTGTCTWTGRYSWTFKGGDALTLIESTPISHVAPGEEIDVSVRLIAPESPGPYAGQWQLTGPDHFEGIGPEVYYLITVPDA